MIKLIQIELLKIFKHKSIYLLYILIILFIILNNILILKDKTNINYINIAKEGYKNNILIKENYDNKEKLTYKEKIEYQENIKQLNLNKYIIENNKDINNYKTLSYQFKTTLEDYQLFIIIIILIVSSTILAEEINKQTIKLLLIKPYSRTKILLSKYISLLIILFISIIFLYISQFIITGLFLGFESLKEKVVIYNFQKSEIMCYNILIYTLIRVIYNLPMLILIMSLSFFISVLTSSIQISITIPIILYLFADSITNLAIANDIEIMKYLLTTNWNFTKYLFGNIPTFKYLNITLSLIVCTIHLIIMILSSIIIFKNKDIKNL